MASMASKFAELNPTSSGRCIRAKVCGRTTAWRCAHAPVALADRWCWAFAGDRDSGGGDARMRADRESAPRRRCPCWRCASAMIHCPACARGMMRGTEVHCARARAILLSARARANASGSACRCAHVQRQETGCAYLNKNNQFKLSLVTHIALKHRRQGART